jgi:hypothetical protein
MPLSSERAKTPFSAMELSVNWQSNYFIKTGSCMAWLPTSEMIFVIFVKFIGLFRHKTIASQV